MKIEIDELALKILTLDELLRYSHIPEPLAIKIEEYIRKQKSIAHEEGYDEGFKKALKELN